MIPPSFSYFASPPGSRLLSLASDLSHDPLKAVTTLRGDFPVDRVREAITLCRLRERGAAKFSRAADMWFDETGLEQASSETVARYRARRFEGCDRVADLCCGIGGDALGLSSAAGEVIAVDRNPARAAAVRWNACAHEVGGRVRAVVADLESWVPDTGAAFFDPDRRPEGRRRYAYADYRPALPLDDLNRRFSKLGVKVAPGIPEEDLPDDCEVEFISERGACKEAVLWFGGLRSQAGRRATLLPAGSSLVREPGPLPDVAPPGAWLYEPDNAVVRAHLVAELARDLDAWLLAPQVAYLSSDSWVATPFAAAFEVVDVFRFGLKRLQGYLRERSVGRITVKKRRFPLDADELIAKLRLVGENEATLVLTRISHAPTVIVCNPSATPG